jgi:hypothetical protein
MYIQSLQPIHTNGIGYLHIVADKMEYLTIKILNVQGMIATKVTTFVEEGTQQLNLNLADLNNGNYILNAFCGDTFIKSIPFKKQ